MTAASDAQKVQSAIPAYDTSQPLSDKLAGPGQHIGQGQKQWAALKGNEQRQKAGV